MSNWTLKELEGQLSKLESEIAAKEEAADELRREIYKLTPRMPPSALMQTLIGYTVKHGAEALTAARQYGEQFSTEGAKIGCSLRIRYPSIFLVSDAK